MDNVDKSVNKSPFCKTADGMDVENFMCRGEKGRLQEEDRNVSKNRRSGKFVKNARTNHLFD